VDREWDEDGRRRHAGDGRESRRVRGGGGEGRGARARRADGRGRPALCGVRERSRALKALNVVLYAYEKAVNLCILGLLSRSYLSFFLVVVSKISVLLTAGTGGERTKDGRTGRTYWRGARRAAGPVAPSGEPRGRSRTEGGWGGEVGGKTEET